ncbi:FtsX-like permease family protein [Fulvivirga sp. M361]|uniref:ABC transporter permease n=1 Tax=Fulvivirga sp. M361 TaxID=2594266 RepID=UPI001179BDC5|nr:ABC transporter permease [Fulvivirga sp. M361]TRX54774.1 FtsX-like permease family protein [Fulvivirga sp. M361]
MFRNYFYSLIRSYRKDYSLNILSIVMMSLALGTSFFSYQYGAYLSNYESHNKNRENVFRLVRAVHKNGEIELSSAFVFPRIKTVIEETLPGVNKIGRIFKRQGTLSYDDVRFNEFNIYNADDEIVDLLDLKIASGNVKEPLVDPNSAIISRSLAEKYFQKVSPISKVIRLNDEEYVVKAVFQDLPKSSHIKIDALFSYSTFSNLKHFNTSWSWNNVYCYLSTTTPDLIESQIEQIVKENEEAINKGLIIQTTLFLQKLDEIFLSTITDNLPDKIDKRVPYYYMIISLIVLLVALFNLLNINASRTIGRMKEIGMRKILGSSSFGICSIFFLEAVFFSLITIALTIVSFYLYADNILNWLDFDGRLQDIVHINGILQFTAIYIFGITVTWLVSSIAFVKIKSISALQGGDKKLFTNYQLRKYLLGGQAFLVLLVVQILLVVYLQYRFVIQGDAQISTKNYLILEPPNVTSDSYLNDIDIFKNHLKSYSGVDNISIASSIPGERIVDYFQNKVKLDKEDQFSPELFYFILIDDEFFETFNLKLVSGRNFDYSIAADEGNVIINEAAAVRLGFEKEEDALDELITTPYGTHRVIGIVRNYHHESSKSNIEPVLFMLDIDFWGYFVIKPKGLLNKDLIDYIKIKWKELAPESAFSYFYFDEFYRKQYHTEERFITILFILAVVILVISLGGLIGMTTHTLSKKMKEMAVRVTLGAVFTDLLYNLLKEYLNIVVSATVLGTLVSYYLLDRWLQKFADAINHILFPMTIAGSLILCFIVFVFWIILFAIRHRITDTLKNEM